MEPTLSFTAANPIASHVRLSFQSLTFITTYKCTAACRECCFECSPHLESDKLTFEFMSKAIDDAIDAMPNIKLVVFSGGECFMLKEELYKTIAYATKRGLLSRCVTNGYWGARPESARRISRIVKDAGLGEINISTGLDHQQWVPFQSVVNCAVALSDSGVSSLITVEKDTQESRCWNEASQHPEIVRLMDADKPLKLISNTWMPFKTDSLARGDARAAGLDDGCRQLFSNMVVTPHKVVSACCGLTFEHIPEMRLGSYTEKTLDAYVDDIAEDFLKLWIHLDGPRAVARTVLGREHKTIEDSVHICQACAYLHKDPEIREALQSKYQDFLPEVMGRYLLGKRLPEVANSARADASTGARRIPIAIS